MKKVLILSIVMMFMITFICCDKKDNSVQTFGQIIEVSDSTYLIRYKNDLPESYISFTQAYISRDVENDPNCSVGDYILVKHSGEIQETYPLGIVDVYSIIETDNKGNIIK